MISLQNTFFRMALKEKRKKRDNKSSETKKKKKKKVSSSQSVSGQWLSAVRRIQHGIQLIWSRKFFWAVAIVVALYEKLWGMPNGFDDDANNSDNKK